jgi:cell shape-determining protein MreC
MKKTYLARRNALLSARNLSWGTGALFFSIIILCLRLLVPNIFWQIFSPVFYISDDLASKSQQFFTQFGDRSELSRENERLSLENAALQAQNATLTQQAATQSVLRTGTGILAGVVVRPPVSPYDTLVVGMGSKDGVTLGMEAFGQGGVPIGIVSSVLSNFSRVTLFSTPDMRTDGWVGHGSIPITLIGAGAGAFRASVSRSANVVVGDSVFVPGPGPLALGSVLRIDSDPISPAVTLRIASAVNPFSLSSVILRSTGITGVVFATSTLP